MNESEWLLYFSDNLYDMMQERKVTQRELSEMTGLAESTISKYINGTNMPKAASIVNIAIALDCTTDELIHFGEMIDS